MTGKVLTQGFRGESFGGENLWGFEGPPNIEEQEKRLLDELHLVEKMNQYVNYENHLNQLHHIREMIQIILLCIKDLRNKILMVHFKIFPLAFIFTLKNNLTIYHSYLLT